MKMRPGEGYLECRKCIHRGSKLHSVLVFTIPSPFGAFLGVILGCFKLSRLAFMKDPNFACVFDESLGNICSKFSSKTLLGSLSEASGAVAAETKQAFRCIGVVFFRLCFKLRHSCEKFKETLKHGSAKSNVNGFLEKTWVFTFKKGPLIR